MKCVITGEVQVLSMLMMIQKQIVRDKFGVDLSEFKVTVKNELAKI